MEESKHDVALAEYAAAQEAYIHYDNYSWQVGAVLIAGVFVLWGLVTSASNPANVPWFTVNLLVWLLMSIWLLYTGHNRQLYLFKIHRIREIEKDLGMCQHRRFKAWGPEEPRVYVLDPPKGHVLDYAVYAIASLGGPILACIISYQRYGLCSVLFFVLLVVAAIYRVCILNKRAEAIIKKLENPEKLGAMTA